MTKVAKKVTTKTTGTSTIDAPKGPTVEELAAKKLKDAEDLAAKKLKDAEEEAAKKLKDAEEEAAKVKEAAELKAKEFSDKNEKLEAETKKYVNGKSYNVMNTGAHNLNDSTTKITYKSQSTCVGVMTNWLRSQVNAELIKVISEVEVEETK